MLDLYTYKHDENKILDKDDWRGDHMVDMQSLLREIEKVAEYPYNERDAVRDLLITEYTGERIDDFVRRNELEGALDELAEYEDNDGWDWPFPQDHDERDKWIEEGERARALLEAIDKAGELPDDERDIVRQSVINDYVDCELERFMDDNSIVSDEFGIYVER